MQSEEIDDGSTLTIENWTGKPVEYRVVVVGDESPPDGPEAEESGYPPPVPENEP